MNALELRALLADPAQAGAYFVDARDTEAMAEAGAALEFAVARIDLDGCADKAELLRRVAAALNLPDWFGHNWDALADSLEDLSWLPAAGYLLLLEHAQDWQAQAGDDAATLLDILNEASAQWAEARKPFWALFPMPSERLDAIAP
jgi:RNAse (barnase) inhibitor barstar